MLRSVAQAAGKLKLGHGLSPDTQMGPLVSQEQLDRGLRTAGFPIHEYWLDIGRLEDLERANEYFESENRE